MSSEGILSWVLATEQMFWLWVTIWQMIGLVVSEMICVVIAGLGMHQQADGAMLRLSSVIAARGEASILDIDTST